MQLTLATKQSTRRNSATDPQREPRYKAIADDLIRAIGNGDYPLGTMLPPEMELCKQLNASRHTMREALRIVTERGLITRRPGSGSCIIATAVEPQFTQNATSVEQLLNYPEAVTRKHLVEKFVALDEATASRLGCPAGSPWFYIGAVRYTDAPDKPLCWVDAYILPKYAQVAKRRDHEKIPVHRQIELVFGQSIQNAEVTLSVGRIPAGLAHQLKAEAGSPSLNLLRRYYGFDGELFQITYTVHPEGRYAYSMNFRREAQPK